MYFCFDERCVGVCWVSFVPPNKHAEGDALGESVFLR